MPNSKQIVYLSQAQYQELITNGTITVDGVTVTYDENDIYVTPQAEPVTDVRVNGTSVSSSGVANIPIASEQAYGAVKYSGSGYNGIMNMGGIISINPAYDTDVKTGTHGYRPICPSKQHLATFYGLAKVAGHDEASSTEPLGAYTPEAKGAIQSMLGVSDLIATAENDLVASKAYAIGDVFTANGKLYKATAAIDANETIILQNDGEEVAGANAIETKVGEGFVKFTDYATANKAGVVKVDYTQGTGIGILANGLIGIVPAGDVQIKQGSGYISLIPARQHTSTFYGLAKAAGDTTQSASSNKVGQYTDEAKLAIRSMLGAASEPAVAAKYTKPSTGIPASDLASAVQTSLGKADTALQSAPVTSVNGSTGAVVLSIPSTAADVGAIAAPASPATGAFLVWSGNAWTAQTLATWEGGSF